MNIDKIRITGQLTEEQYQSLLNEIDELRRLTEITVITKGQLSNGDPTEYQITDNHEHAVDDLSIQTGEIWTKEMDDEGNIYDTSYPDYEYTTQNVKQKLYIHIDNNLNIRFTLNPNRFANNEDELITNMLIRFTSELNRARITHVDFNIDVPYNTSDMSIKYNGNYSFSTDGKRTKNQTEMHYYKVNVSKLRELIIYDKLNERIDKKFNKEDDSYISRNYANQLRNEGVNLTRIELRLLKASKVGNFLNDYRTALKGFKVRYRQHVGNNKLAFGNFIDIYGVNHSKSRISFNQLLNQQLKLKIDELAKLPYVTQKMIENTKKA